MKPLSLHHIAFRRRHRMPRSARQSPIAQACDDELAMIVDHHRNLAG